MDYIIPEEKILGYLLTNPKKSGFFLRFGYELAHWVRLRDDILLLAKTYPMQFKIVTPYGRKYTNRGSVKTPVGRVIQLTAIWMIATDTPFSINFLTAYPT